MTLTMVQPTVQTKRRWGDGWTTQSALAAETVVNSLQPLMPTATFAINYGRRNTGGNWSNVAALAEADHQAYVRLRLNNETIWIGRIVEVADAIGGSDPGAPTGDQRITAYGLEYLLGRIAIDGSYIIDAGEWVRRIDTVLPFNLRGRHGNALAGNRSADRHGDSYVFATDGELWSAVDMLEYLLTYFAPKFLGITLAASRGNVGLSRRSYRPRGSLLGCMNDLVDRRRGTAWRLDYSESETQLQVRLCSTFDASVRMGKLELVVNSDTVNLDLDGEDAGGLTRARSAAHRYDYIVARGGPVIVCGSVSIAAATLAPAWSTGQAKAYNTAPDTERKAGHFDGVYTRFRLVPHGRYPFAFDLFAADPRYRQHHHPLPDVVDGKVKFDEGTSFFMLGKSLLRQLPLLAGWDYSARTAKQIDPDAPVAFIPPRVWCKSVALGETRYIPLGQSFTHNGQNVRWPATVKLLTGELGIDLAVKPRHHFAKGHFAGATAAMNPPVLDYENLVATVAVASDRQLEIVTAVGDGEIIDSARTLTIDVPGCECWVLLKGTALDLDEKGELVLAGSNHVLRNDAERLRVVAELARAWYGRTRQAVQAEYVQINTTAASPGQVLATVTRGGAEIEINALVVSVEHAFGSLGDQGQSTIIRTDYAEMDFVGIARAAGGAGESMSVPSLSAPDIRDRLVEQPVEPAAPAVPWPWRVGQVLDGTQITPAQAEPYYRIANVLTGVYFEEVNPFTLQPFPESCTRDRENNYRMADDGPVGIARFGRMAPAGDFHPLAVGALFDFYIEDDQFRIVSMRGVRRWVRCLVTESGGDAGDKTTQCSLTYTARAEDGVTVLGEDLAPEKTRPVTGKMAGPSAGSVGWGYFVGATFHLYDANETLDSLSCDS